VGTVQYSTIDEGVLLGTHTFHVSIDRMSGDKEFSYAETPAAVSVSLARYVPYGWFRVVVGYVYTAQYREMALTGIRDERLCRARLVNTCVLARRMDAGLNSAGVLLFSHALNKQE